MNLVKNRRRSKKRVNYYSIIIMSIILILIPDRYTIKINVRGVK